MNKTILFLKSKLDKQSKVLFKNSSWIFGSNIVRSGLVFIRSIVIARGLGVELYGTFAVIAAFVVGLQEFFNLNVGGAFIRFGADYKTNNRLDKLMALMKGSFFITICTALLSLAVIALILVFNYDLISSKPHLQYLIFLYAVSEVFTFFDPLSKSYLRLYYKFKINSIIQTISSFVEFILVCGVILLFPKNIEYYIVVYSIAKIIGTLVTLWFGYRELGDFVSTYWRTKVSLIKDQRKEIINFIVGNSLSKTLLTVMNQGDTFLIGTLAGPIPAGYYNIGKKLAASVSNISNPLMQSIYPQLSLLLSEKKNSEIRTMLIKMTRLAVLPGLVFIAAIWFFNEYIIKFLYGIEYLPAANAFTILTFATVMNSTFFWTQPMMQSFGLIRFRFFTYLFAIATAALLSYYLIPLYQSSGLAISLLVAHCLINATFVISTINKLKER